MEWKATNHDVSLFVNMFDRQFIFLHTIYLRLWKPTITTWEFRYDPKHENPKQSQNSTFHFETIINWKFVFLESIWFAMQLCQLFYFGGIGFCLRVVTVQRGKRCIIAEPISNYNINPQWKCLFPVLTREFSRKHYAGNTTFIRIHVISIRWFYFMQCFL